MNLLKKPLFACLISIIIIALSTGYLFVFGDSESGPQIVEADPPTEQTVANETVYATEEDEPVSEPNNFTGNTFEFDNIEITLGNTVGWTTVDNSFSDFNGETVFYIPITVVNLANETHGFNSFWATTFGSTGTRLDSITAFFDNDITWAGNMRAGATQSAYWHFLYDGDGDYFIEIDDFFTQIEIMMPIRYGMAEIQFSIDAPAPSGQQNSVGTNTADASNETVALGDTFIFDDLEITFGTEINWTTLSNQFSDFNGRDVFYIPVTVTNISDGTHGLNTFWGTVFGIDGTRLENISFYFNDDIALAGNMRSGATQTAYWHFLYEGSGDYVIEFDDFSQQVELVITINR